jgi:hypothetical protein
MEHPFDKKSATIRKQEVIDIMENGDPEQMVAYINDLVKQAYIAGANLLDLGRVSEIRIFNNTGYTHTLSELFAKDKGL